ncbi:MAG: hypothetical protein AAFO91_13775, partial [Bacteroidota bacterium]
QVRIATIYSLIIQSTRNVNTHSRVKLNLNALAVKVYRKALPRSFHIGFVQAGAGEKTYRNKEKKCKTLDHSSARDYWGIRKIDREGFLRIVR